MDLRNRDPRAAEPTMMRLTESLAMMRAHRAPSFGKVALIDAGGTSCSASCEQAALAFALRCLAEATARDPRIADARDQLEERLRQLTAAVRPRAEYSVVHGELGLDHVMVDRDGHPVVIDIENLLYFDVEWEHVFLRLRHTNSQYQQLAVDGLDEDRLALYKLTQHLSLTKWPAAPARRGLPRPGVHARDRRASPERGTGAGPGELKTRPACLCQGRVISEIVGHKKPDETLRNDVSTWDGPPPVRAAGRRD